MAEKVTTLYQNVSLYIEQLIAGAPTFVAVVGDHCIVTAGGTANDYICTGGTSWRLLLRDPLDLALALSDAGDGLLTGGLWLRKTFPAGAVVTTVLFPARVGGWRVVDAYINASGGAGAGTLQVKRSSDSAVISNAMALGGAQFDLTRASSINLGFAVIPSGSGVDLVGVVATTAGEAFVRVEPL
jgi:hypothetical protein